jgi:hypothetical protein
VQCRWAAGRAQPVRDCGAGRVLKYERVFVALDIRLTAQKSELDDRRIIMMLVILFGLREKIYIQM